MRRIRFHDPDGEPIQYGYWVIGIVTLVLVGGAWIAMATSDSSNISNPAWGLIPGLLFVFGLACPVIAVLLAAYGFWKHRLAMNADEFDGARYKRTAIWCYIGALATSIIGIITWIIFLIELAVFS